MRCVIGSGNSSKAFTKREIIERTSWLIQSIKSDCFKRLFGLPVPLVRGEKLLNLGGNCKENRHEQTEDVPGMRRGGVLKPGRKREWV